jgi:hypothetical protein
MKTCECSTRVVEISNHIPLFPLTNAGATAPTKLPEVEIGNLMEFGIPNCWQRSLGSKTSTQWNTPSKSSLGSVSVGGNSGKRRRTTNQGHQQEQERQRRQEEGQGQVKEDLQRLVKETQQKQGLHVARRGLWALNRRLSCPQGASTEHEEHLRFSTSLSEEGLPCEARIVNIGSCNSQRSPEGTRQK